MSKRIRIQLIFTFFLTFFIIILFIPKITEFNHVNQGDIKNPKFSANLEGAENIIVTDINRRVDIDIYGLITIRDKLTINNLNSNPISSIFIGIPLAHSIDLIFFDSKGVNENSLVTERSNIVMNEYEMFAIYFDSPLLPYQSKIITFIQIFKDQVKFYYGQEGDQYVQYVQFTGIVFPILPYKSEGDIIANYFLPVGADDIDGGWGFEFPETKNVRYEFNFIKDEIGADFMEPFLVNLNDQKEIAIMFKEVPEGGGTTSAKLEVQESNREIYISPWGIIKVKENVLIKNLGVMVSSSISLNITRHAKGVYVSDDLGEIFGVTVGSLTGSNYRTLTINLFENRINLLPNSSFRFNIEYNLPFENYISSNGFQESIQIDLLTTIFNYLGRDQTIKVVIDGCYSIDSITEAPMAIKKSKGTTILTYKSDFVSPLESKLIYITFTIDFFNLLLRPIVFILIIAGIASTYVLIIKTKKKEHETAVLTRKFIPIVEIREFCSLSEEKNALFLEIRQVKEDARRKKIAGKKYKNILEKNTLKIEKIQQEIVPFKKILIEASEIFENIMKRLDILEAERISVTDGLKLLESRYKRGRLPSRAAYLKLSEDFNKRRRKIDRTIDKLIQQLRSYLL